MGIYYLCSKNKGVEQLRGYREAGLRLSFRICKLLGFLMRWLIFYKVDEYHGFEWAVVNHNQTVMPQSFWFRPKLKFYLFPLSQQTLKLP